MPYVDRHKGGYRAYYLANKEAILKQSSEWYQNNKEYKNKLIHEYRQLNRQRSIRWSFIFRCRLKEKLFHILGHVCKDCGQYDKRILEFHHINGGGKKERRIMGTRGWINYYIKNPDIARKNLEVLCANCHVMKRYYSNISGA